MLADIIKHLGPDVIIISNAGIGSINGCVLTARYAKANDISVKGIILNKFDPLSPMHQDNIKMINRLCRSPVIGYILHGGKEIKKV